MKKKAYLVTLEYISSKWERPELMNIITAGLTDVGLVRKSNQDAFCIQKESNLIAIADGIGGHAGGEHASQLCIQTIKESIEEDLENQVAEQNPREVIRKAISLANNKIFGEGELKPELKGMGTTVELFYFTKNRLFIGHVGDSRVYLLSQGLIWQLTRDHSVVEEKAPSENHQQRTGKSGNPAQEHHYSIRGL